MFLVIAFLGGMVSLLSPCTLPVIPLLFAGFRGQRRQLIAMLCGMVIMFTAVASLITVASDWVVNATIVGRWTALALLSLAALALIFPSFAQRIAGPALRLGNVINSHSNSARGMVSAVLAGLAVGLLWSPCAGPVLGAILSLSLAGHSPVATGSLLAAYGSGCAVMLALLGFSGQALIARLKAKSGLMDGLRKAAGVAMLMSVAFTAFGLNSVFQGANGVADRLEKTLLQLAPASNPQPTLQPVAQPVTTSAMPSLEGGTGWLNGEPVSPASLKGKVVLIDFWTWDCINCQHSLPFVRDWANKYKAQGLVVVGVHTPEYPWEKPLASVQKAIDKWQLPYRVVADNNYKIWTAFGNRYWPAHYFFDAKGQLRYASFGEGNTEKQEQVIQQLLKEAKA
ncbi:cytochrome c biogenesis protein/redoxin [Leclercia barmai]|uniref:cytochrome c biogenesis protein/redoxin n=1 Tax=Leclercia TaxID=83654 RepID=UPI00057B7475|nr:cytochrome c biogenesis protein/redoxin [Leclercia adecarboxylata]